MNDYVPSEFYLGQNYPNPFKGKTTIKYCIAYKSKVRITLFNSQGGIIARIVDEIKEAGTYEVEFSVEAYKNKSLKNETIFYQIEAGVYSNTKTMILNQNLFEEV